jgi:hypothetical protein
VRKALAIACFLLFATLAFGGCVEVTSPAKALESSGHVRIVVLLNGRRMDRARVYFCTPGADSCISVVTGDDGIATPPPLTHGYYTVAAELTDGSTGDLFLQVSDSIEKTSTFLMDLTKSFNAAQKALAESDKLPIRERVEVFRGAVRDPSGAILPRANIKIFRRGSADRTAAQMIKSDDRGQFSAQLGEGAYVAFFSFPGFRTEVVPFEIAAQGTKEMLVKLQVGRC